MKFISVAHRFPAPLAQTQIYEILRRQAPSISVSVWLHKLLPELLQFNELFVRKNEMTTNKPTMVWLTISSLYRLCIIYIQRAYYCFRPLMLYKVHYALYKA